MRFCIIDIIYNICHSQLFEFSERFTIYQLSDAEY